MNIGIVTTWFDRGAAYVSRAYRDVLRAEHQVFIYARGGERYGTGDPAWDGPDVTWGRRAAGGTVHVDWPDFAAWVARRRLDLIFFNEQTDWDVVLQAQALDVTLGSYIDFYLPETVPFFGLFDFLVCNTRRHHSVFTWHPQAHYVPWGTDVTVFRPRTLDAVAPPALTFFHSCGMSPWRKGTDILLRAFRSVNGPARLVVHTQTPLDAFVAKSAPGPADDRVTVVHETVGPPGLYHLGDVYAYPTRSEGIGLSLPEALAAGLPVITTDSGPMSEFLPMNLDSPGLVAIEPGPPIYDGYYWPLHVPSEAALAERLQWHVDHRADLRAWRAGARAHAEAHLDWKKNAAQLPALFAGAARRRSTDPGMLADAHRANRRHQLHRHFHPAANFLRGIGAARVSRFARRLLDRVLDTTRSST